MASPSAASSWACSFHSSAAFPFPLLEKNEPTWRCHQNPFIGDLGIQEPVILGEPQIFTVNR